MSETIEQKCLSKGVKLTDQRRVIAKVMSESSDHPDVDELYKRVSKIDTKISLIAHTDCMSPEDIFVFPETHFLTWPEQQDCDNNSQNTRQDRLQKSGHVDLTTDLTGKKLVLSILVFWKNLSRRPDKNWSPSQKFCGHQKGAWRVGFSSIEGQANPLKSSLQCRKRIWRP